MYLIAYEYHLLDGKTITDVKLFIKNNWDFYKRMGARYVEVLKPVFGESASFYATFKIESLDKWNEGTQSKDAIHLLKDLFELVNKDCVGVDVFHITEVLS